MTDNSWKYLMVKMLHTESPFIGITNWKHFLYQTAREKNLNCPSIDKIHDCFRYHTVAILKEDFNENNSLPE